jgi:hypothetical protein
MAFAIRIDIEAELAAAARGECLACRIGARHGGEGLSCPQAKHWGDVWCARGAHDYPKDIHPRTGSVVKVGPCRHCGAL